MLKSFSPSSLMEWVDRPAAFLHISYPAPKTATNWFPDWQHYAKGHADVQFVLGWVVLFWLLREVTMQACSAFMRRWLANKEASHRANGSRRLPNITNGDSHVTISNGHEILSQCDDLVNQDYSGKRGLRARHNANGTISPPPTPPNSRRIERAARLNEKKVIRFSEQGWSVLYWTFAWLYGCYIHYHSPYYPFDLDQLWTEWPHEHYPIPGPVKFYYLMQLACWISQIVILNVEARRSDHAQMMTHHFVTSCLIILSYQWNFVRVGCLILVLMDFCDILLPLAKMVKYLEKPFMADVTFGVFIMSWLVTRIVLFNMVVLSVIYDTRRIIPLSSEGIPGVQLTRQILRVFAVLLGILAVLLVLWFGMIARVAIRVLRGGSAEDTRSDDEDGDLEEPQSGSRTAKRLRDATRRVNRNS